MSAPPPQGNFYPPPPNPGAQGAPQGQFYPPPPPQQSPPQAGYAPPPGGYAPPPSQSPAQHGGHEKQNYAAHEKNAAIPQQGSLPPLNVDEPGQMPGGAPDASHFVGASATQDDIGTFNGGSYRVSHRDSNSVLTVQLAKMCPLTAKPGAMIAMSHNVTLTGSVKFSMKKLLASGDMASSTFKGPGELLLAPSSLGDITQIELSAPRDVKSWNVGKDAFLACTEGVIKDYKRQSFSKAMFSGEGLFTYQMSGYGLVWIQSFGAIIRKTLTGDEKYVVDNGHLVAWDRPYTLERVASGGIISGLSSGEGLVCVFTAPATIFLQTRNPQAFAMFVAANSKPA
ncbi:MAG: hypothetical protein M1825_006195 [Sarcosagium campestre]|nr:MAG: hypothetical protein M1825_006195 [Sarcosagium campestre]